MTLRVRWLGRLSPSEIGRYLLLGSAIYCVSLSVMYCLTALLGLGELASYALVQLLIGCTGCLAARRWVFRAREGHLGSQAGRFLASSASFRLLNLALYSFLWSLLAVPREIGIPATTALLLPVKYVVEKTLIFNRATPGSTGRHTSALVPLPIRAPCGNKDTLRRAAAASYPHRRLR